MEGVHAIPDTNLKKTNKPKCYTCAIHVLYMGEGLVHASANAHRGPKRTAGPLELELQVVVSCWVWVLGTGLRSSGRATKVVLNC